MSVGRCASQVIGIKASGRFTDLGEPRRSIITGRDEIGHPKLYAEIAEPRCWNGVQLCTAGWMGFRFLDLAVSEHRDVAGHETSAPSDGTLMLKYVPRTGAWGETDLRQVTLTPAADPTRPSSDIGRYRHRALPQSDLVGLAYHAPRGERAGGVADH